jgi:uncharacterized protein YjbI with pentapeptide repeats
VNGGSENSFGDGPMVQTFASSSSSGKVFPIGKEDSYRPITLTITHEASTETQYTAEVFNQAPTTRSRNDIPFLIRRTGANLSGANLGKAWFVQTDLDRANLEHADLRGAMLIQSNLSWARLIHADLRESNFLETILINTNLKNAKNLVSIKHAAPSIIDLRTLEISGDLPIEFLRGCGLSDWQIEAAKLQT